MSKAKTLSVLAVAIAGVAAASWYAFAASPALTGPTPATYPIINVESKEVVGQYTIPSDLLIEKDPDAEAILYGKRLLNETRRLLPDNVGAAMNCNSCHIDQGKAPRGAHYINSFVSYPKVMPRSGKMVDLAGRINGCFMRSMNGKAIPVDSPEMQGMLAYMKWLAQGVQVGQKVQVPIDGPLDHELIPNPERGKALYAVQCASCHGEEGQGLKDERGNIVFPPLWGDESFNIGAGMARTFKAAVFIKYNMPMSVASHGGWGQGGVLNDQDAVDIAEYFTHMPRPDFAGKVNDWPNGKKPKDARY
ncbi:cytochrome C [Alcaligenes faecalis]|uniref:c-type cytochrome n=1 Tax=Alcaligenes faecalis TaxID=511 RepID=UPI0005F95BB1|nr:c-type cytochrome [Alcaligenes faecalis]ALO40043.1 cytochrome C [Alcaligenes faecalis]